MKVFWFCKLNFQCFFVFVLGHIYLLPDLKQKKFFGFFFLHDLHDPLYFLKNCFDTVATILAQTKFKQSLSILHECN